MNCHFVSLHLFGPALSSIKADFLFAVRVILFCFNLINYPSCWCHFNFCSWEQLTVTKLSWSYNNELRPQAVQIWSVPIYVLGICVVAARSLTSPFLILPIKLWSVDGQIQPSFATSHIWITEEIKTWAVIQIQISGNRLNYTKLAICAEEYVVTVWLPKNRQRFQKEIVQLTTLSEAVPWIYTVFV